MSFEIAILSVRIARSQYFAGDYPNPTRERGTHGGTRRERRKSIPRLRFGLRLCGKAKLQKI